MILWYPLLFVFNGNGTGGDGHELMPRKEESQNVDLVMYGYEELG